MPTREIRYRRRDELRAVAPGCGSDCAARRAGPGGGRRSADRRDHVVAWMRRPRRRGAARDPARVRVGDRADRAQHHRDHAHARPRRRAGDRIPLCRGRGPPARGHRTGRELWPAGGSARRAQHRTRRARTCRTGRRAARDPELPDHLELRAVREGVARRAAGDGPPAPAGRLRGSAYPRPRAARTRAQGAGGIRSHRRAARGGVVRRRRAVDRRPRRRRPPQRGRQAGRRAGPGGHDSAVGPPDLRQRARGLRAGAEGDRRRHPDARGRRGPVEPGGGPRTPRQSDAARLRARPPLQRVQRRTPRPAARAIRPRAGASAAIDRSARAPVDAKRRRAVVPRRHVVARRRPAGSNSTPPAMVALMTQDATHTIHTPDGPMAIYEAVPETPAASAVIVIQEAFGVNDYIRDVTRRFAAAGFHAVAPAMFHRAGGGTAPYDDFSQVMPLFRGVTDDGIVADVDATVDYLRKAGFDDDRIGIVGFCFGGRVTFLVATRRNLGAAVGFYGGGIVSSRLPFFQPLIGDAARLATPWFGLFGDADAGIPVSHVEQLRE